MRKSFAAALGAVIQAQRDITDGIFREFDVDQLSSRGDVKDTRCMIKYD